MIFIYSHIVHNYISPTKETSEGNPYAVLFALIGGQLSYFLRNYENTA